MRTKTSSTRLTRRALLASFGAGMFGGTAIAGPASATAGPNPLSTGNLQRGDMADWAEYVGRRFSIAAGAGAALRLVAVEPLCSDGPLPRAVRRRRRFAASFESVGATVPDGDAAYWVSTASAAPLPLYLGARATVAGKARFVAVFN